MRSRTPLAKTSAAEKLSAGGIGVFGQAPTAHEMHNLPYGHSTSDCLFHSEWRRAEPRSFNP